MLFGLCGEEAVFGPWQAKVFAQCGAFIGFAEQAPALQLRHHLVDEIVQTARQIWEHDVEAVADVPQQLFLHFIGDHCQRAKHGETGLTTQATGQLANG